MNRSILIVICDFLLVSLLAFSTVDINKVASPNSTVGTLSPVTPKETNNNAGGRQDLGDVMRLALEREREQQQVLAADLAAARAATNQQETLLRQRQEQLQAAQAQLQSREELTARLQAEQTNLYRQFAAAQSNVAVLNEQLRSNSLETMLTREERNAEEAEARKRAEQSSQLRAQLSALQQSNQLILAEREQLAGQLQSAESEKVAAARDLARTQEELQVQRRENTQLSEGVKNLAAKSSELTEELRGNQTLAPNAIFNDLSTNRVSVDFYGSRPGFFGNDVAKHKQSDMVLATDGSNTFAVCHVQNTLLALWNPGTPWKVLTAAVAHGEDVTSLDSLSFYQPDPRLVLLPVSRDWARQAGCKAYPISANPYNFQNAIVIGINGGSYGESQFHIDLSEPSYIKLDRSTLKGWFGQFNPSTGDLVFSRKGELVGVMVNNTYCVLLQNFDASRTVRFGTDIASQKVSDTLSLLSTTVTDLPLKLQ